MIGVFTIAARREREERGTKRKRERGVQREERAYLAGARPPSIAVEVGCSSKVSAGQRRYCAIACLVLHGQQLRGKVSRGWNCLMLFLVGGYSIEVFRAGSS
eukprot:TRINITY_DN1652_c0_g1_i5.p1 TRINITY_DN1652_c0_g1~~TRINITY_DN1652_c0_g1_i5.p1  ORF type:complete len:102 (-),score=14.41 TRINITY_DN1652_c0_g1_i5:168-473(-)